MPPGQPAPRGTPSGDYRETDDGARPNAAAIDRIEHPAASPREISSRSANDSRDGHRRRGTGWIPPHRIRYARTVLVHNPSSRAVGFAACPAFSRTHTWSIAAGVNRSNPHAPPSTSSNSGSVPPTT